ncbi:MAG: GTP-binding protein [Candidatus Helarchaeota archaeon]
MATLGDKLNILLGNYLKIPDIRATAIVDQDGLIMASSIDQEEKESIIAACSGALSSAAQRIKQEISGGYHLGAIVSSEQGEFIFTRAGDQAILITLAKPGADTDKILPWSYIVAEKIQQLIDLENLDLSLELPKMKDPQKFNFKLVVLGNEAVGKTSLIRRFIEKSFKEDYKSTIGVSILNKTYELSENVSVTLNIWDLAGQQMFRNIRKTYLEGAQSAVLVYDVTRQDTFEAINSWLDELQEPMRSESKFIIMLIGNKIDLKRKVTFEEAKNFSKNMNIPYLETSAKTGDNVDKAFGALCYHLIKDSVK